MPVGDSFGNDLLRFGMATRSPVAGLFGKQRAFFDDPAKLKAAVCGRRAGKTFACAVGLYQSAKKQRRSLNPYVALSGVSARRIMWPVLEQMNETYKLGLKLDAQELIATLPENGSKIFCVGGDDHRKIEALRGPPYPRVVIDEAGSYPRALLRYLCEDVLDAALMDHDGDMWLVGTPNAACVGHFYDITTGSNPEVAKVPTHHWTVLDNSYVPHASEYLARKRLERNWTEEHPVYRREYLGHWVRDGSSLVFRFDRSRHAVHNPPEATRCVLGVDLGVSDSEPTTAFVVVGWTKHDRTTRVLYANKSARLNPESAGDIVAAICKDWPVSIVVVDQGGLGKGYADMWRQRADIGKMVKAAEKREKLTYVEFLNGELDAGRAVLTDRAGPLAAEIDLLQWNEDRDGYDDRFADHCADAWLYAWRECYAWSEADPPPPDPMPGTLEYRELELQRHKDKLIRESIQRAARVSPAQALARLRRY